MFRKNKTTKYPTLVVNLVRYAMEKDEETRITILKRIEDEVRWHAADLDEVEIEQVLVSANRVLKHTQAHYTKQDKMVAMTDKKVSDVTATLVDWADRNSDLHHTK